MKEIILQLEDLKDEHKQAHPILGLWSCQLVTHCLSKL